MGIFTQNLHGWLRRKSPALTSPAVATKHSDYVCLATARLPIRIDDHEIVIDLAGYRREDPADELVVLAHRESDCAESVALVRIHSACLTGEAFGSMKCDCGYQLDTAIRAISESKWGFLVYQMGHEGRGIGLLNKIRAYSLQDAGLDTVEANEYLGLPVDSRDYTGSAAALRDLGATRVRLMTNNPDKIAALESHGIEVVERVPIEASPNEHNCRYLEVKRDHLRHMLKTQAAPERG